MVLEEVAKKVGDFEEIKIRGKFKIKVGNKLVAKGKNKWTRYFASTIGIGVYSAEKEVYYESGIATGRTIWIRGMSYGYTSRVGSDVSTPTNPFTTSDLASKIDVAPSTQSRLATKSSSYGNYQVRFKFVWEAGALPETTIGEFGVYLYLNDDSWSTPQTNTSFGSGNYDWVSFVENGASRLAARVSAADGDFDSFYYDSLESLYFEWYVTIVF